MERMPSLPEKHMQAEAGEKKEGDENIHPESGREVVLMMDELNKVVGKIEKLEQLGRERKLKAKEKEKMEQLKTKKEDLEKRIGNAFSAAQEERETWLHTRAEELREAAKEKGEHADVSPEKGVEIESEEEIPESEEPEDVEEPKRTEEEKTLPELKETKETLIQDALRRMCETIGNLTGEDPKKIEQAVREAIKEGLPPGAEKEGEKGFDLKKVVNILIEKLPEKYFGKLKNFRKDNPERFEKIQDALLDVFQNEKEGRKREEKIKEILKQEGIAQEIGEDLAGLMQSADELKELGEMVLDEKEKERAGRQVQELQENTKKILEKVLAYGGLTLVMVGFTIILIIILHMAALDMLFKKTKHGK